MVWCAAGSLPGGAWRGKGDGISASDGPLASRPAVATPAPGEFGTGWVAGSQEAGLARPCASSSSARVDRGYSAGQPSIVGVS